MSVTSEKSAISGSDNLVGEHQALLHKRLYIHIYQPAFPRSRENFEISWLR